MQEIYHANIVQISKLLGNLDAWLDKASDQATKRSFDMQVLLNDRLAPDMFPLIRQVQSACDAAKFLAARLAGKEAPKHADTEQTLDEIRVRVRAVREYLGSFKPADFAEADSRVVPLTFMEGKGLTGRDYMIEFAVPNFFFHVTTAYAILRHNGVDVGKYDYIGAINLRDL